jgi:hypothetical protein
MMSSKPNESVALKRLEEFNHDFAVFANKFVDVLVEADEQDRAEYQEYKNRPCNHDETRRIANSDGSSRIVCMKCLRRVERESD